MRKSLAPTLALGVLLLAACGHNHPAPPAPPQSSHSPVTAAPAGNAAACRVLAVTGLEDNPPASVLKTVLADAVAPLRTDLQSLIKLAAANDFAALGAFETVRSDCRQVGVTLRDITVDATVN